MPIYELDKALRQHRVIPSHLKDRAGKEKLLQTIKERDEEYYINADFDVANLLEELEEKRKIFAQEKELWKSLENFKTKNAPKKFNIETVTKYLRDSKIKIGGETVDISTVKPVVKGRELYHSHKIMAGVYIIVDGKLLIDCIMGSSMGKDPRYVVRFNIRQERKAKSKKKNIPKI